MRKKNEHVRKDTYETFDSQAYFSAEAEITGKRIFDDD